MTSSPSPSRRSARERLLETADRLFYAEGIHAVGIDRILEESGVAKGSLYYNFGGKDDLVRAYLRRQHAGWVAAITARTAQQTEPRAKILAAFEALVPIFASPTFVGCAFHHAAAEAHAGSTEDLAVKEFRTWLYELFAAPVDQGGYDNPQRLVAQLVQLFDGANMTAAADHDQQAAEHARAAADVLLAAATPH
ncbi:TetR/AcrR family transcriptional regulator [Winogradskya humida]|uniref:TetR family transcriptional regulator n=1 Tax=Winogradskya humida TaxID=113566 RepID=A0ABQ3ZKT3_9ACTN|nr:TetR/AcrR family transcriptional regulator [Actinoplanes humidus]GIE19103.1 TetR family transcriptional regulator [Actinoplanes humidus]